MFLKPNKAEVEGFGWLWLGNPVRISPTDQPATIGRQVRNRQCCESAFPWCYVHRGLTARDQHKVKIQLNKGCFTLAKSVCRAPAKLGSPFEKSETETWIVRASKAERNVDL